MTKKSKKSGRLSSRKKSRYEDAGSNHNSSSRVGVPADQNPSYNSPFSNYFRRSRELVPFEGFNSSEEETDNQVVDVNPVISNEADPADELQLTKGSDCEDCGLDATPEVVHTMITKIVKPVLSQHQNSTLKPPKGPVRVFGQKYGSSRKVTLEMHADNSIDMAGPITDIIPMAAIADISSLDCVGNTSDQLQQQSEQIQNNILIEESGEESNQTSCCSAKQEGSLNITDMVNWMNTNAEDECSSVRETTLETVEGYTVSKEFAATLRLILTKHRDIAAKCSFQDAKFLSFFLEKTCEVVEKLDALELKKVTIQELRAMQASIADLEPFMDVQWLKKRVSDIMETKAIVNQAPSLKEKKVKAELEFEKTKKAIEALQEKVEKEKEKLAALGDECNVIKKECGEATVKVKRFHNKSLIRDLL